MVIGLEIQLEILKISQRIELNQLKQLFNLNQPLILLRHHLINHKNHPQSNDQRDIVYEELPFDRVPHAIMLH